VSRDFTADTADEKWCGDLTEIPTDEGKPYLAIVIDLAACRIPGFAIGEHHDAELAAGALKLAAAVRAGGDVDGVIFHSDKGLELGFKWPSQHLDQRGAAWDDSQDGPMQPQVAQRFARRKDRKQSAFIEGKSHRPGAPTIAWREDRVRFWVAIARGLKTEDADVEAGVSSPVAHGWFHHAGGVKPALPPTVTGRYLSFSEREDIAIWHAQEIGVREIGRRLNRDPSTISRELRRNASSRAYPPTYKASTAQWHAERRARRPKTAKLCGNKKLHEYVQERLSGQVMTPDGQAVGPRGPQWKGRNKPHRADRRWTEAWSAEQIAKRLPFDFPDDESMRISHEVIYQALYIQGRGALKRELVACLRIGRPLRVPRSRSRQKAWAHVTEDVLISKRPAEAEDRAVPGHWEGDLIIGFERSAIGTVVERTSYTLLVHLPREERFGIIPRTKNGPPLAGYGAVKMKDALAATMSGLPVQLRRSLTGTAARNCRSTRHSESRPESLSTSPTRIALGSAAPTRTPMDCFANTSPREPTSRAGTQKSHGGRHCAQ
jgi:IS30 family transposase